jgi:hypothetical protein
MSQDKDKTCSTCAYMFVNDLPEMCCAHKDKNGKPQVCRHNYEHWKEDK